jgi:hypothetical protein
MKNFATWVSSFGGAKKKVNVIMEAKANSALEEYIEEMRQVFAEVRSHMSTMQAAPKPQAQPGSLWKAKSAGEEMKAKAGDVSHILGTLNPKQFDIGAANVALQRIGQKLGQNYFFIDAKKNRMQRLANGEAWTQADLSHEPPPEVVPNWVFGLKESYFMEDTSYQEGDFISKQEEEAISILKNVYRMASQVNLSADDLHQVVLNAM